MTTGAAGTALCINTGSSSLKAALVRTGEPTRRHEVDLEGSDGLAAAIDEVVDVLLGDGEPAVVGHRVVHGGVELSAPIVITDEVLERLRALIPLAPLHQPAALAAIEQVQRRLPDVPGVACFDTAFHRRLPEPAQRLPLGADAWEAGVRRYGFHGLSYEYVVGYLGARLAPRTVIAHLGSGASLVALQDGEPVDTTMSLTPGGGLVMATRSGDLDPGVVLRLLELDGDPTRLMSRLEHGSGMRGISGSTGDVRSLLRVAGHDPHAREAVDAFVASAAKYIAAMTTVLAGLDLLVFTGGIGSGSPEIRAAIAGRLAHLGVTVRPEDNEQGGEVISHPDSPCTVVVVKTDEEAVIAEHALRLVSSRH